MPFFSNGKEFESTIIAYIERKIDNANKLGVNDDNEFIFFSENVWNDIIKTKWATILLNNNLVSKEQLNNIDKKIDEWKHSLGGSKSIFIYGIIVLLALIILVTVYIIYKKNKKLDEINQLNEIKVEIPKKNNDEKSVQDVYDDLADNFEDDIDDENNLDKK